MKTAAVVAAAGQGKRLGARAPKQYLTLNQKPVLAHTLQALAACPAIEAIVLVVAPDYLDYCWDELLPGTGLKRLVTLVAGGPNRQDSVYRGLTALAASPPEYVAVHDGARPFVPLHCLEQVLAAAYAAGAAILAVPAKETLKLSDAEGRVEATLERSRVWIAQTPQVFAYPLLLAAYEQAQRDGFYGTDDASLVERTGASVAIVSGSYENIKLTTPEDLLLAEAIIRQREAG